MGINDAFRSLVAAPFRDVIFEWQVFNLGSKSLGATRATCKTKFGRKANTPKRRVDARQNPTEINQLGITNELPWRENCENRQTKRLSPLEITRETS